MFALLTGERAAMGGLVWDTWAGLPSSVFPYYHDKDLQQEHELGVVSYQQRL